MVKGVQGMMIVLVDFFSFSASEMSKETGGTDMVTDPTDTTGLVRQRFRR